jgi:D-3-phosphoglycerate dehydrogenase
LTTLNPQSEIKNPKSKMSILLLESLHADAETLLAQHDTVVLTETPAQALAAAEAGGVSSILTRGKGRITRELMQACGNSLKAVCRAGAGLDTVDVAAAKELGIAVIYAPGKNAATTAEHTMLLMLAAARKLAVLNAHVKAGDWAIRATYEGIELNGKTLGIIGMGNIGSRVAWLAQAFGMNVLYWSRAARDARWAFCELDDLLREADVVSLHIALNEQTKGMIGIRELSLMKPNALLINTARGALVDASALEAVLVEGRLGGYAADVMAQQPPDPNDPLLKNERATLTPHVAGLTDRTYRDVCLFCAQNVLAAVKGEAPDAASIFV